MMPSQNVDSGSTAQNLGMEVVVVRRLIVFRNGYMDRYDGPSTIEFGGSEPEQTGVGGEMWNFAPQGGVCYGYVMTKSFAGVDLGRVDPSREWCDGDELSDVDIVFIAKKPGIGQVVVGWYKSATLFHRQYRFRPGRLLEADWEKVHYLCEVDATRAFLLDEEMRTFRVPYAPTHGDGFIGQSHVWYADSPVAKVRRFLDKLHKYIALASTRIAGSASGLRKAGGVAPWGGSSDLIYRVEQAAVERAKTYFVEQGYRVRSVERDCRGWDLEAKRPGSFLRIEVKGHIGNVVRFELSPNEYSKMKRYRKSYRVFLVRDALGLARFEVFAPRKEEGEWQLYCLNGAVIISLSERTGAKATEKAFVGDM